MFDFEQTFKEIVKKELSPEKVIPLLLKKHLRSNNLLLTEEEVASLSYKMINSENDRIQFSISDERLLELRIKENAFEKRLQKTILEALNDGLDFINEKQKRITSSIGDICESASQTFFEILKEREQEMLGEKKIEQDSFFKIDLGVWGLVIEKMFVLKVVVLEIADNFNSNHREEAEKENNYVFDVLTRLLARSCQVYSEILILLEHGFADGAMARWRTLHEITVIAHYIESNGNDIALKYLAFEKIESYKAARLFQEKSVKLNIDPIPETEFLDLKTMYDELIVKYGKNFKSEYGWASESLNIKNPNFSQIETQVELDHLRPYYKSASFNVHANPKGIFYKLGSISDEVDHLLAGPSIFGLQQPAFCSANSLGLISLLILNIMPSIDNLILSNLIIKFQTEIHNEIAKIEL